MQVLGCSPSSWPPPFWYQLVHSLSAGGEQLKTDFGFTTQSFAHFSVQNVYAWGFYVLVARHEWSRHNADFRRLGLCLRRLAHSGFRTEMEHLAVLVIPLALIFAMVHDRWQTMGDSLTILLLVVVFLIPWAGYFFGLPRFDGLAREIMFLFLPLLTIIGLYWIRWWEIRPPRTWADLANRKS